MLIFLFQFSEKNYSASFLDCDSEIIGELILNGDINEVL